MAEEGGGQATGGKKDIRMSFIQEKLVNSLKIKEEAFQKLLVGETRCAPRPRVGPACRSH